MFVQQVRGECAVGPCGSERLPSLLLWDPGIRAQGAFWVLVWEGDTDSQSLGSRCLSVRAA